MIYHVKTLIDNSKFSKDSTLEPELIFLVLSELLNCDKNFLKLNPSYKISVKDYEKAYNILMEHASSGASIYRLLGYRYFWKDKFYLSPATLEPRPDTEIIIEAILKHCPNTNLPYRMLDIATGTGCILLSLCREFQNASGIGADIQQEALDTAFKNQKTLALTNEINWIHSDWFQNITFSQPFDIIISNPPYIPTQDILRLNDNVKNFDPRLALDGGQDGLNPYRIIASNAHDYMHKDSLLFLEIGWDQAEAIIHIFKTKGYTLQGIYKDYGGNDRCLVFSPKKT